jgi:hypothetical protein
MLENSCLAEWLLASQKGFCSMELEIHFVYSLTVSMLRRRNLAPKPHSLSGRIFWECVKDNSYAISQQFKPTNNSRLSNNINYALPWQNTKKKRLDFDLSEVLKFLTVSLLPYWYTVQTQFLDNFECMVSGIALGYGLDDWDFDSREGLGIILLTTASKQALWPTQPPMQWVPGSLSLWAKRPVREADHSPPSNAEVKNAWSYNFTPPIPLHGVVLS